MKKEMYKMLAAALMLSISGGVVGSAADTVLDTVYVNADRDRRKILSVHFRADSSKKNQALDCWGIRM